MPQATSAAVSGHSDVTFWSPWLFRCQKYPPTGRLVTSEASGVGTTDIGMTPQVTSEVLRVDARRPTNGSSTLPDRRRPAAVATGFPPAGRRRDAGGRGLALPPGPSARRRYGRGRRDGRGEGPITCAQGEYVDLSLVGVRRQGHLGHPERRVDAQRHRIDPWWGYPGAGEPLSADRATPGGCRRHPRAA